MRADRRATATGALRLLPSHRKSFSGSQHRSVVELSPGIDMRRCDAADICGVPWRMSIDLERHVVETAYARWAPIYDAVCGPVMVHGRRAAAQAAREVG